MIDSVPEDFLWGAAIHGRTVNGDSIHDNWIHWEQRLGSITHADHLGKAADHWTQYREDFRVARDFGMNAVLIALEWSRIEPRAGEYDDKALKQYGKMLDAVRDQGLSPIIALHHVAIPNWFSEGRAWRSASAPAQFAHYARVVMEALGDQCDRWIPVLEPMHYALRAYRLGHWPPAQRNQRRARRVEVNLIKAHHAAFDVIKELKPDAQVGVGIRVAQYRPRNPYRAWDARAAKRESRRNNFRFVEALNSFTEDSLFDFIGVTHMGHYDVHWNWRAMRRVFVRYAQIAPRTLRATPDITGFKSLLHDMAKYGRPLYVLGAGARGDDAEQCAQLLDNVSTVKDVLKDGIDLRSYLHYALLNGFEWEQGYQSRHGLFHVDPERFTRTPKPAALVYKELLETGKVRPATLKQFCPQRAEATS